MICLLTDAQNSFRITPLDVPGPPDNVYPFFSDYSLSVYFWIHVLACIFSLIIITPISQIPRDTSPLFFLLFDLLLVRCTW